MFSLTRFLSVTRLKLPLYSTPLFRYSSDNGNEPFNNLQKILQELKNAEELKREENERVKTRGSSHPRETVLPTEIMSGSSALDTKATTDNRLILDENQELSIEQKMENINTVWKNKDTIDMLEKQRTFYQQTQQQKRVPTFHKAKEMDPEKYKKERDKSQRELDKIIDDGDTAHLMPEGMENMFVSQEEINEQYGISDGDERVVSKEDDSEDFHMNLADMLTKHEGEQMERDVQSELSYAQLQNVIQPQISEDIPKDEQLDSEDIDDLFNQEFDGIELVKKPREPEIDEDSKHRPYSMIEPKKSLGRITGDYESIEIEDLMATHNGKNRIINDIEDNEKNHKISTYSQLYPEINFHSDTIKEENIKQYIYKFIQNNKGKRLPYLKEICDEFNNDKVFLKENNNCELSLQQANDIRSDVVDDLIDLLPNYSYDSGSAFNGEYMSNYMSNNKFRFDIAGKTKIIHKINQNNESEDGNNNNNGSNNNNFIPDNYPNYFSRVGSLSSNFNKYETDYRKDPFDHFIHSKSEFRGQDEFDPAFFKNGMNLDGLNPASNFGYNNYAYENYIDAGRILHELDSEFGKFRTLAVNTNDISIRNKKNSKLLGFEMLEELKRKIEAINSDFKTIALGLTSVDRKEYIGDGDFKALYDGHKAGINDIFELYYVKLLNLCHKITYLRKSMLITTSGVLNETQLSLFMNGSCRLVDSGTRFIFNSFRYGQIPIGGMLYKAYTSNNPYSLLYYILSSEPMNMYDALELNLCDYILPSNNGILFFKHLSDSIDNTFLDSFKELDKYNYRQKLSEIIEFYDRGLEYYQGPMNSDFNIKLLISLFCDENNSIVKYDKFYPCNKICTFNTFKQNLIAGMNGKLNCQRYITNKVSEDEIRTSIEKCKLLYNNLFNSNSCPLAIQTYYEIYKIIINSKINMEQERHQRISDGQGKTKTITPENLPLLYDHFLHLEYHIMCNLMQKGKNDQDSNFIKGIRRHIIESWNPLAKVSDLHPTWNETHEDLDTLQDMSILRTDTPDKPITIENESNLLKLPQGCKPLNLPMYSLYDSIVFPKYSFLDYRLDENNKMNPGTWNSLIYPKNGNNKENINSINENNWTYFDSNNYLNTYLNSDKNEIITNYSGTNEINNYIINNLEDFTYLRGNVLPLIESLLRNNYGQFYRILHIYNGRLFNDCMYNHLTQLIQMDKEMLNNIKNNIQNETRFKTSEKIEKKWNLGQSSAAGF